MRVLLTGASGFIGAATHRVLRADGCEVVTAGRSPDADVSVDLTHPGAAAALVADVRPTRLVHLAWASTDRIGSAANLDWVGHTAALLRACVDHDVDRVVTAGTCFEYGAGAPGGPGTPATRYGAAKRAVGDLVAGLVAAGDLTGAHARVYYVYGPGEEEPRLFPAVGRALARGEVVETTDGLQRRDYVYVDDVAAALSLLVRVDASGTYDLASGTAVPVHELIDGLARRIGRGRVARGALARRPDDPDEIRGDPAALGRLGWTPRIDLETGLDRSVDWLMDTRNEEPDR